jgi:hypothetical protein
MAADPVARPRGRPPVFTDDVLLNATGYSYARRITTRRGAQDLVYRMFAIAVLEHYCEAFPDSAEKLEWLLAPRRRHTLLSELGRVARPRSGRKGALSWTERDVELLVGLALEIAEKRPSTKDGVALLRSRRRESGSGLHGT